MSSTDEQSSSDAVPRPASPSAGAQTPSTGRPAGSSAASSSGGATPSTESGTGGSSNGLPSAARGTHRSTPPADAAPARKRPPTRPAPSSQVRPTAQATKQATKQAPGKRANRDATRTGPVPKSAPPAPAAKSKPPVEDKPKTSAADRARAAAGILGEGTDKIRNLIASIVWLLAVLGAVILALGALLYALDAANRANEVVDFFISTGERLVGPFDTVFQFGRGEDGKEHLVNWGLAAVVYLIVGKVLDRIIRPSK